MKLCITASLILKMAEGPISFRPRKVVDYACDEVGCDTYVRKEGGRGNKKVTIISMLLPIDIVDQKGYLVQ